MEKLVIYHAACADGFCAAWLFHAAFSDAEFVPAQYGDAPPDVTGKEVYIVDFSYKRPVMMALIAQSRGVVVVLDHHKSAEVDLANVAEGWDATEVDVKPKVWFDMTKSGGRLAWEHLENCPSDSSPPWLVAYTEDRDLWRWQLPFSRAINAALRSHPMEFEVWDELSHADPVPLVSQGEAIIRAESQTIAAHVRNAREITLAGHRVLVVNATTLISEIAGELAKDRPFGACFFDTLDGKRVWSLRSREGGIDVSKIAEKFGGGGGASRAAGFWEGIAPIVSVGS